MKKAIQAWLAILFVAVATPIFAGSVYIPYSGGMQVDGVQYITRLWVTNTGSEQQAIQYYRIQQFANGTERQGEASTLFVNPGQTRVLHVSEGLGLIEVVGPPQMLITARLIRNDGVAAGREGIQLPVVSADDVGEAGETLHLQGWERRANGNTANTTFGLVNFGRAPANCEVDVFRADGTRFVDTTGVPLAPLSHINFDEVLGILGQSAATDVRVAVSCTERFYTYAAVSYPGTDDLVMIRPAKATNTEVVPGGGDGNGNGNGDFVYLSDLNWAGAAKIQAGPLRDRTGFNPHAAGGPRSGYRLIQINGVTYEKGISWFPAWNAVLSSVAWNLGSEFTRLEMIVRFDDEVFGAYEWGVVNRNTGDFLRLERPADGYRGRETFNRFRIGSSGSLRVIGDGRVLYSSPEFHAYGAALNVSVDLTGVNQLRIELNSNGHEEASAPYRNGLPSPPALVKGNVWHDLVVLADPKLFR